MPKWSLWFAAMVALLIFAYALIYYAAGTRLPAATFESQMPSNYRDTLRALVIAGGNACADVCGVKTLLRTSGATVVDISCRENAASSCARTQSYRVTVEAAPSPVK